VLDEFLRERSNSILARRMTAYKRPELLFEDLERLRVIARNHPFQIVLAGKLACTLVRLFHTSDR